MTRLFCLLLHRATYLYAPSGAPGRPLYRREVWCLTCLRAGRLRRLA